MSSSNSRYNDIVTIKIDVRFRDHPQIIGAGGWRIAQISKQAGCYIHFPDINRLKRQATSNEVCITGDIGAVECGRILIRCLTSLVFSFEIPLTGGSVQLPDLKEPYIASIEEEFNVKISFHVPPNNSNTLVFVKGWNWEHDRVKEGTNVLLKHMFRTITKNIQVQTTMKISPQYYDTVLGFEQRNLKEIMQKTGTAIIFTGNTDPRVPNLKKSNIIIRGPIDKVYLAKQQLSTLLPLILSFDLPYDTLVHTRDMTQLMRSLQVVISFHRKRERNKLAVIIEGIESEPSKVYKARQQILSMDESSIASESDDYRNKIVSAVNKSQRLPSTYTKFSIDSYSRSSYDKIPSSRDTLPSNSSGMSSVSQHQYARFPYPYSSDLVVMQSPHNNLMPRSQGLSAENTQHIEVSTLSPLKSLYVNTFEASTKNSSPYSSTRSLSSFSYSPEISPWHISTNGQFPVTCTADSPTTLPNSRNPEFQKFNFEKIDYEIAMQQHRASFQYEQNATMKDAPWEHLETLSIGGDTATSSDFDWTKTLTGEINLHEDYRCSTSKLWNWTTTPELDVGSDRSRFSVTFSGSVAPGAERQVPPKTGIYNRDKNW